MIKIETKQLQEGAILAQPVITPLGPVSYTHLTLPTIA